jgi:hypothetical protein
MGIHQTFPALTPSRADIEALIELLIAWLDDMDGDPECETCDTEDDFALSHIALGVSARFPGCQFADGNEDDDPAEDDDDDACAAADDGCFVLYDRDKRVWGSRHHDVLPMLPSYPRSYRRGQSFQAPNARRSRWERGCRCTPRWRGPGRRGSDQAGPGRARARAGCTFGRSE